MNDVYKLLGEFDLPAWIAGLKTGDIAHPSAGWSVPDFWYPHPPSLIPILADDSAPMYLGILKHWFVKGNLSFVQFDLEQGSITEIAKTSEQFSVYLLINALGIGCSVESTRKLSHSIGFEQTERVIAHALKYGDDEKEIWRYWGGADEGTVELANGVSKSEDSTSLVETDPRTNFKSLTTQPAPMPGVRARSFEGHYLGNRLSDAWIELVSPGWSVRDAKVALGEMLKFSPAIAFAIQSKLWLSAANEKSFY